MPKMYTCSGCRFEFNSGHSHHSRAYFLCCKLCGTLGELFHERSDWGPDIDEMCRFRVQQKNGKMIDTDIEVKFAFSHRFVDESLKIDQACGSFDVSGLICAECNEKGVFVFALQQGEKCPRCRKGKVIESGDVMY